MALDGRAHVDLAMRLSPLDPLHYAMSARAPSPTWRSARTPRRAEWADRAARSPGAHVLIAMIAAAAHGLTGDEAQAAHWAANVRARNPALTRDDFFRAFPMKSEPMRARVARALGRLGF